MLRTQIAGLQSSSVGSQKKIHIVHFRAVRGTVPRYTEVFIDEGDVDMLLAMKTHKEVVHTGHTHSHGYMRALVHAVNTM